MSSLRQQLSAQLRAAALGLGPQRPATDQAIHATRQHIKRARAILCLLRPMIDSDSYRSANRQLRQANRRLRYTRDRASVLEALQWVGTSTPYMKPAVLAIRQHWRQHRPQRPATDIRRDCQAARQHLIRAIAALRQWPPLPAQQQEFAKLAIRVAYRRARRAYRHAKKKDSESGWHECRKATKSLYYQWQAMSPPSRAPSAAMREAHVLESTLGRERDLRLLARAIRRTSVAPISAGAAMLERIGHDRAELRRKAKRVATRLF